MGPEERKLSPNTGHSEAVQDLRGMQNFDLSEFKQELGEEQGQAYFINIGLLDLENKKYTQLNLNFR